MGKRFNMFNRTTPPVLTRCNLKFRLCLNHLHLNYSAPFPRGCSYLRRDWWMENFISAVFHTMSALSAPFGHLPLEGKATIQVKNATKPPPREIIRPRVSSSCADENALCVKSPSQNKWGLIRRISYHACETIPANSTLSAT